MKLFTAAPLALGFAHWRFEPGQDSLVLALKGCFRLQHGGRAQLLGEPEPVTGDVFTGDEPELGACCYASDVVPFKPKGDALLVGNVHAPGGTAVTQCHASFAIGGAALSLRVTGDRHWLDDARASEPRPFTAMALGYERAFGGPGWLANPAGKGAPVESESSAKPSLRPLPNIEDPASLIKRAADRPPPAGFGPLAPHWGHRLAKWPAVTQSAIEERWPWAPAELDYAYFNAAQPALQVDEYFRGDETLSCENLHPEHRRYSCQLPGLRPRCFVVDKEGERERFREVALRLDTAWVDMGSEKLVLVWRGSIAAQSLELDEIEYVYVAVEELDSPRVPLEQHRQVFELSRSEADAAKRSPDPHEASANDNEARPAAQAAPAVRAAVKVKPLPADLRSKLVAMGTPNEVLEAIERGDNDGAKAVARAKLGMSEAELDKKTAGLTEQMKQAHVAAGGDPSAFEPPKPAPPAAPTAPPAPTERRVWTRPRVEAALAAGQPLVGADLSELDLSGLDLRGLDLAGCLMRASKLDGTKLDGAKLDGANLSGASAPGTSFQEASLLDADLTGLVAPGSDFSKAKLAGALFDGATLTTAKLRESQAAGASFRGAELADADASGADLSAAVLERAHIDRMKLCGAMLDGAIAEGVVGEKVDFRKASLVGFRASENSSLRLAALSGCNAEGSRWMGADLSGAEMTRALFASADLSRTNLEDAALGGADCRKADFTKAKLGRANLSGANLTAAQLEAADLRFADLRDCCLYQANLWRAQLSDAQLGGAFTAGTLLQSPVRGWAR